MNSDEYLEKRLKEQIDWYDAKSLASQKLFKRLRATEIVAAAMIPFLSGIAISNPGFTLVGTVLVGILGMAVTIIAGFLSLGQYQENWTEYRMTCESLLKEKLVFETGVEPYNGDDAFHLLVQRVENLVSKENTHWGQYTIKPVQKNAGDK